MDLDKIDKKAQGWGLQLDGIEIKKLLERLLWECAIPEEFHQRCEFIFDNPNILLIWREQKRSVVIRFEDGREIEASIGA